MQSPFERVRVAWCAQLPASLQRIKPDVKVVSTSGEWWTITCPMCDDRSGSASLSSQSGFLNCRQCGKKANLFDWLGEVEGRTWQECCKGLAEELGVEFLQRRSRGRPSAVWTPDCIDRGVVELWLDPEAARFRDALAGRNLKAPHLEQYRIHWWNGKLVFPQLFAGEFAEKAKCWLGPTGRPKWIWSGKGKVTPHGLWPQVEPPREGKIWILAGEWDVLVARELLKLQDMGIHCYCWTGGETTPLLPGLMPDWLQGREVLICYDNDTYQGPRLDRSLFWAPDAKRKHDGLTRRKGLLATCENLAEVLNCRIGLLTVPVRPQDVWGGDLRDWYERGGRNVDEFEHAWLDQLEPEPVQPAQPVPFAGGDSTGRRVSFAAMVDAIVRDFKMPASVEVHCQAGAYDYCRYCQLLPKFPSRTIEWVKLPTSFAKYLATPKEEQREEFVWKLINKPKACQGATCAVMEGKGEASYWVAMDPSDANERRRIHVVGPRAPDPGSIVRVTGQGYLYGAELQPTLLAEEVVEQGAAADERSLAEFESFLLENCPHQAEEPEQIDAYLTSRYDQLSAHVTGIDARPEFHLTFDLVAHSVIRLPRGIRGWLDACIVADTRTGKTEVADRMIRHLGIPTSRLALLGRWSEAGMVGFSSRDDRGNFRTKIGIFPAHNRKMLVLDELQASIASDGGRRRRLFPMLQEARDRGICSLSMSSRQEVQAQVRLLAIGNPIGDWHTSSYACDQLLRLYTEREAVARLDFALVARELAQPSLSTLQAMKEQVPLKWTADRCSALRLRAWWQQADDVIYEDGVEALAVSTCEGWARRYSSRSVPLFHMPGKIDSLLRIAVAIANLTYSHPFKQRKKCLVRPVHVAWAARWLERTWDISEYSLSCKSARSPATFSRQRAELELLAPAMSTALPAPAMRMLYEWMGGERTPQSYRLRLGRRPDECDEWIAKLQDAGVLEQIETGQASILLAPTKAGGQILRDLGFFIESNPGEWEMRRGRLINWRMTTGGGSDIPYPVDPLPRLEFNNDGFPDDEEDRGAPPEDMGDYL